MTEPQELTLAPVEKAPVAALPSTADVGAMLHAVVNKGITTENVSAMESLVKLYEHMQAVDAKRAFAAAFNALQAELPVVQAMKAVPTSSGGVKYKYAPMPDLMKVLKPLFLKHQFTVSFSCRPDGDRIVAKITLLHVLGHSESGEFAIRACPPHGGSASDADESAGTRAIRYALCNMLNITIDKTGADAGAEGTAITKAQADELEHRVAMLNVDRAAFLRFAHADSFAAIPSAVYEIASDYLARKEAKGK